MVGEMESGFDTRFPLDLSNLITHQQKVTKHKLKLIKSKSMSPKMVQNSTSTDKLHIFVSSPNENKPISCTVLLGQIFENVVQNV